MIIKSLYNLHSKPEKLYGYEDAPYKIPGLAYGQAMKNFKIRDPRLEAVIMKYPEYAYWYAYALGHRWPEAEPYIMQNSELWNEYKRNFDIK